MNNFKRVVILYNPNSTNSDTAQRHIEEIKKLFAGMPCDMIQTAPSIPKTMARLRENRDKLGKDTLLCIAGGDGTVNRAVEFLQSDPSLSQNDRETVILPLWAGNANDLANMVNGSMARIRMPALFENAKITPIHPLVCTLTDSNDYSRVYRAASYVGIGVTASVARTLNSHSYRANWRRRLHLGRLVVEFMAVWRTITDFNGFKIEENDVESALYERSYVNGTRMGKLQPLAASLTECSFLQTTVYKKDKHIFGFYRWLRGSTRLASKNTVKDHDQFTALDSIWMQCDGEPIHLEKDTQVTIECSLQPLYVLATKLDKSDASKRKFKK